MLEDAPGHNWGHLAVRIESGDDVALYPGHLVLSLAQVDAPDRDVGEVDVAVAAATRRKIFDELARRRGLLLTTLIGGPGGGMVTRRDAGFELDAPR
jgi:glyoxylase-like metal-dependent hydrolase (beta-lactamase superfamily II)